MRKNTASSQLEITCASLNGRISRRKSKKFVYIFPRINHSIAESKKETRDLESTSESKQICKVRWHCFFFPNA